MKPSYSMPGRSSAARWALMAGATLATTAMLATGSVAASAAALPADGSSTSAECIFGEHLVRVWLRLPADLRSDLKELKNLEPGQERTDGAREVRDSARDGKYGSRVEKHASRGKERRMRAIAQLPEELRQDLKVLKDAEPDARPELATGIADAALDGEYGERAQKFAERVQASDAWQNCVVD